MKVSSLPFVVVGFISTICLAVVVSTQHIENEIYSNRNGYCHSIENNNLFKPSNSDPSLSPLPILPKITSGLDITRLDLKSKAGGPAQGFLNPVLQFSFDQQQIFTNNAQGIRHLIPDQVKSAYPLPAGQFEATTIISNSVQEWTKSTLTSLGLGPESGAKPVEEKPSKTSPSTLGKLSGSVTFQTVKSVTSDASKSFISTQGTINSFRYELTKQNNQRNRILLNPDFLADISTLPKAQGKLSDAEFSNAYQGIINKYGTHYFGGALFGGSLDLSIITNSYLHKTIDENKLKFQAGLAFMNKAASFGYATDTKDTSSEFTSESTVTFQFFGGQAPVPVGVDGKPNYKSWQDWTVSVSKDPWILQAELLPITDLIPDPSVQAILKQAIDAYVFRSYLTDLSSTLSQNFGKWNIFDEMERSLNQAINSELSKPLLKTVIDYDAYEPPRWFRQDVQLCYETSTDNVELCRDVNKFKGCVSLNEWATLSDSYIPSGYYCQQKFVRLYLKSSVDVDFVQNGCFVDPFSPKPCLPLPQGSQNFWNFVSVHSYPGMDRTENYFPGNWMYQYNRALPSNSFISKLAICFNYQDKDPRTEGIDKSSSGSLYCTSMTKAIEYINGNNAYRNHLSFSLRDILHPV